MEEHVGALWHRFITRAAQRHYSNAAVTLTDIEKTAGLLFRALGGDPGLRVTATTARRHGARRGWLARIAGSNEKADLASRDAETLQLPAQIALFRSHDLNYDLYIWLIALASTHEKVAPETPWWRINQQATLNVLEHYSGLQVRYQRLVAAALEIRIPPERLPLDEAAQESQIRQALREPGSVLEWPAAHRPPQPIPLWLYPAAPTTAAPAARRDSDSHGGSQPAEHDRQRRRAERSELPERQNSFLSPFRSESLLSWADYVRVNRPTEDDLTADAARVADEMDRLSVTQDSSTTASRVRFDLDLPAASQDDLALGPGIKLPEWDYRKQTLLADYCAIQEMLARHAEPCELPPALRRNARRLRRQFEILRPGRGWRRAQPDGEELDLDACVHHAADQASGNEGHQHGFYRQLARQERSLACLLLADLSMSTDAWVNNQGRVIELIRDSLFLFSEALAVTGDRFALYGFSSRKRQHVRVQRIKSFEESYNGATRGRINAIKPGYYTRMGAAVRYTTGLLGRQAAFHRLLLLLTDGKPNDLDQYEGRYGIEDTRMALLESRRAGLQAFCVTIDQEANDYLPYVFGKDGFILVRHPEELPHQLLRLYTRLTG